MSRRLDRAGIFRARPLSWCVRDRQDSAAIAISIEYQILAQLDGSDWADWSEFEEHTIFGDHYVVKRDGTINTVTVEQLAESLGWSGDLRSVTGVPPDVVVQITVKAETYNGVERLKVAWINPGDFSPRPESAAPETVAKLQSRFGSLLRAAAGSKAKKPAPPAPAAQSEPVETDATGDPLPF